MPTWLDTETIRALSAWILVAVGVAALVVARYLQIIILKGVVIVVLIALAVGVWLIRSDLGACSALCDCQFAGRVVAVPASVNPNC